MSVTTGLIFLRHSLPAIDPAIPAREWRLSEEGQLRCRLLAERLANLNPQRIVSSLEPKALETAQIVAETLGLPYESADGLHEHVRSQTGHTSQDAFEASVKAFFEQPDKLVYGDETADQAYTRFNEAVGICKKLYPSQVPLVIVSHGTVISLFISRGYHLDPFSFWKSLTLPCMVILSAQTPNIVSYAPPPHTLLL